MSLASGSEFNCLVLELEMAAPLDNATGGPPKTTKHLASLAPIAIRNRLLEQLQAFEASVKLRATGNGRMCVAAHIKD